MMVLILNTVAIIDTHEVFKMIHIYICIYIYIDFIEPFILPGIDNDIIWY